MGEDGQGIVAERDVAQVSVTKRQPGSSLLPIFTVNLIDPLISG